MRCRVAWMMALLVIAVGTCAGAATRAAATPAAPTLEVRDAWIRWLPGAVPGGGYLTLVNSTDSPQKLTAASSDAYGSVSLHQSVEQGGVSSMHPVDGIVVKPHSTLVFGEHGYHLMLMDAKKTLKAGDTVTITLHLADGSQITSPFQLRSPDMLMSK